MENLSMLNRRAKIGNLYLIGLTIQRGNITGRFLLLTQTEGRVLRASWTLKNLSVLGLGHAFFLYTWLLHACPFGSGHLSVDLLLK